MQNLLRRPAFVICTLVCAFGPPLVGHSALLQAGGPEAQAQEDPLIRAVEGMRSAHEQIAKQETGTTTQQIQQHVIRELERLIDMARQPPPQNQNLPSQSPQQSPQPDPAEQQQAEPQPQPQPAPAPAPGSQQQPQPTDQGPGGQDKQQPEGSEERNDPADLREAELARREAMMKQVWGHLPPAVRQKLLNVSGDKYLPKYEDLARRYFEALAEQETRRE